MFNKNRSASTSENNNHAVISSAFILITTPITRINFISISTRPGSVAPELSNCPKQIENFQVCFITSPRTQTDSPCQITLEPFVWLVCLPAPLPSPFSVPPCQPSFFPFRQKSNPFSCSPPPPPPPPPSLSPPAPSFLKKFFFFCSSFSFLLLLCVGVDVRLDDWSSQCNQ